MTGRRSNQLNYAPGTPQSSEIVFHLDDAAERCYSAPSVPGVSTAALSAVPLFAELGEGALDSLAAAMGERTYAAGEVVTAEGAAGDGLFVVESGQADVTVSGQPRGSMGPGDYFGEIALLTGSNRTATVTAASELRCYVLTPADFRTLVEGDPSIAWNVMQSMAFRLS